MDKVNANLAVGYDKRFTDNGFDPALRSANIVKPETFKLISTPKAELNSPQYGFGYNTERNVTGHSGGFPGLSSNLDMYVGNGWTAIVMSNYSRGSGPLSQKMGQLIAAKGN